MFGKKKEPKLSEKFFTPEGVQFADPATHTIIGDFSDQQKALLKEGLDREWGARYAAYPDMPVTYMPAVMFYMSGMDDENLANFHNRRIEKTMARVREEQLDILHWMLLAPEDSKIKSDWRLLMDEDLQEAASYVDDIYEICETPKKAEKLFTDPYQCGAVVFAYIRAMKRMGDKYVKPLISEANRYYKKHGEYDLMPKKKTKIEDLMYQTNTFIKPLIVADGFNQQLAYRKKLLSEGKHIPDYIPIPHANDGIR